ncbi:hypothetical protein M5K25_025821 [Dendrobium thyrsiflorum]|uniref:Uncharacterized protein n=1 Tax=Dendrobium thyrsiflorum TaxID=117978 RepID=A0ABD0U4Y1_DENTH
MHGSASVMKGINYLEHMRKRDNDEDIGWKKSNGAEKKSHGGISQPSSITNSKGTSSNPFLSKIFPSSNMAVYRTKELSQRMVGEWIMDTIKIPWFRHPGPSWSLVYLVIGGSQPNLTEGSLSAAMGCFVQGYLDLMPLGNIWALAITVICGAIWRQNHSVQRASSHNRLSCGGDRKPTTITQTAATWTENNLKKTNRQQPTGTENQPRKANRQQVTDTRKNHGKTNRNSRPTGAETATGRPTEQQANREIESQQPSHKQQPPGHKTTSRRPTGSSQQGQKISQGRPTGSRSRTQEKAMGKPTETAGQQVQKQPREGQPNSRPTGAETATGRPPGSRIAKGNSPGEQQPRAGTEQPP